MTLTEIHTCPKCGAQGAAFICSEPGCPVNGGAAYGLAPPAGDAPRVKIHLILNGYAICATRQREGGRQALTTIGVFKLLLDDERCERCAAKLRRIEDAKWNEGIQL